jgi:membrane-associated phospholipid phosphatase
VHWLQTVDVGVFRFINGTLSNPVFDVVMPFASGNRFFFPVLALVGMLLLWKGGKRGWLCALMVALILWPGDSFICNTLKHAIARPRPFVTLPDVNQPAATIKSPYAHVPRMERWQSDFGSPAGEPNHNSMPSSHAANWFAATMICYVFYRRSWRFMLPIACLVSFSRIYNGVHYPSDVLAGAILGAGYAAAGMWAFESIWRFIGQKWFPLWHERLPSLVNVRPTQTGDLETEAESPAPPIGNRQSSIDDHWLRLGYIFIAVLLFVNLMYLASGLIELSEDEAYQWVWSKHLALSYYSKPPLIAYTQWLGTHLCGDTEFGVRFFSPIIGAILGLLLLRFFAREVNARAGFFLVLIVSATPLLMLGSILMTVDPLSVLFWTAAMISGWRAVQPGAKTGAWLWTGLWMGLGFLSKYTELFQLLCWVVFFFLWKPARAHLRKPGPYLALLINCLCAVPVLIWNQQHHWVTISHVASNAKADKPWEPSLRHLGDFAGFIGAEAGLLNPIFFVATVWACIAFWRRGRHDPRLIYLFSMGAPLFLSYLLFSFHSGILPNWIAPSVLPLFCLMVIYWDTRWRLGVRALKGWLIAGLSIGFVTVAFLHETDLMQKIVGRPLPPKPDPLTRVRAYSAMARKVEEARAKLLAEGKPVFVIGAHYGTTGLLSFYMPEARTNIVADPLVYYISSTNAVNQFYFWPGYKDNRTSQNAIFVKELGAPSLVSGTFGNLFTDSWIALWLKGEPFEKLLEENSQTKPAPEILTQQFDSVTDLGLYDVYYRDRVFHTIQIFECRNLH